MTPEPRRGRPRVSVNPQDNVLKMRGSRGICVESVVEQDPGVPASVQRERKNSPPEIVCVGG